MRTVELLRSELRFFPNILHNRSFGKGDYLGFDETDRDLDKQWSHSCVCQDTRPASSHTYARAPSLHVRRTLL